MVICRPIRRRTSRGDLEWREKEEGEAPHLAATFADAGKVFYCQRRQFVALRPLGGRRDPASQVVRTVPCATFLMATGRERLFGDAFPRIKRDGVVEAPGEDEGRGEGEPALDAQEARR